MKKSKGFLPGTKKLFVVMTISQFTAQIFSDFMRSLGYDWPILAICQIFYVVWGLAVCVGFGRFGDKLWEIAANDATRAQMVSMASPPSSVQTSVAITLLFVHQIGSFLLQLQDRSPFRYWCLPELFVRADHGVQRPRARPRRALLPLLDRPDF